MLGALIMDKPAGFTSHDVVARARQLLHERRIGHTGTLDPFATGVLVLLIGAATRLAQFLSGLEKEYEAIIRLGFATDTGDVTGRALTSVSNSTAAFDSQQIESALSSLRGEIDQVPPMYSAKKQQGRRLYEFARRGEEVERAPVRVCVRELETIEQKDHLLKDNRDGTFDLKVRVVCSAGTYVRTLAQDFGKQMGVGAHLAELRRTRIGHLHLARGLTLESVQETVAEEALGQILVLPDEVVSHLQKMNLDHEQVKKVRYGVPVAANQSRWSDGEHIRMRDDKGNLVAVGRYQAAHDMVHPAVVMPQTES